MPLLLKLAVRFCIFLPPIFFLGTVLYFSEPLFLADDFHLLETIVWLEKPVGMVQKLRWLLQQHNEHRILVPRVITWLDYQLEGSINWQVLMLVGNMIWCGVLYFLWSAFRSLRLPLWYFVPVPWLIFHPLYYDNLTWTISVLQQSVIVFLLSWLVYAFANRRFGLAVGVFLLATFTHGNGIVGFGIGLVFLALYRDWRRLGQWALVGLATALVYFYGFSKGQSADFGQSLAAPLRTVAYFCAFLGAEIQSFGLLSLPAVAWGALLVVVLGGFLGTRLYTHFRSGQPLGYLEKMLLGHVLFIGVTALLVAVSRSWLAINYIIPPRYAHYSPYLTAWFYLAMLSAVPRTRAAYWAAFGVGGAALIWLASYINYLPKLEYRRDALRVDKANWKNYRFFTQYSPAFNINIQEDYTAALKAGICQTSSHLPVRFGNIRPDSTLELSFEQTRMPIPHAGATLYEPYLSIYNTTYYAATPLLVVLPATAPPVWLPLQRTRNSYRSIIQGHGLHKMGMATGTYTRSLPTGRFRVGLYSGQTLTLTRYQLEVLPDHSVRMLQQAP